MNRLSKDVFGVVMNFFDSRTVWIMRKLSRHSREVCDHILRERVQKYGGLAVKIDILFLSHNSSQLNFLSEKTRQNLWYIEQFRDGKLNLQQMIGRIQDYSHLTVSLVIARILGILSRENSWVERKYWIDCKKKIEILEKNDYLEFGELLYLCVKTKVNDNICIYLALKAQSRNDVSWKIVFKCIDMERKKILKRLVGKTSPVKYFITGEFLQGTPHLINKRIQKLERMGIMKSITAVEV